MIAISDWHDFRPCVDSTVGDVVQLVRTLPCRWLESHTVTAEPQNQLVVAPIYVGLSTMSIVPIRPGIFLFRVL